MAYGSLYIHIYFAITLHINFYVSPYFICFWPPFGFLPSAHIFPIPPPLVLPKINYIKILSHQPASFGNLFFHIIRRLPQNSIFFVGLRVGIRLSPREVVKYHSSQLVHSQNFISVRGNFDEFH